MTWLFIAFSFQLFGVAALVLALDAFRTGRILGALGYALFIPIAIYLGAHSLLAFTRSF